LLAAEQIRSRFHSAEPPFPDVRIELVGYINVPRDKTVKIWHAAGGTFQNNLLKFEDPQTGHLLDVFHEAGQRQASGVDSAREIVEADRDPGEWSIAVDPRQWSWEVVAR
jgi:hypothetical protein